MARYYQRPENALKKANEFIEVGKPTRALDTLYDVIKGKGKHRAFSEKVIEPIMLKYLELCVELRKPHTAKEGLYQYRLMCQSVNIGLLEKVIRWFITMAKERTEQAKNNLKDKVLLETCADISEVDDLDNLGMADMALLNVVTEEQAQERSDRAALIPWVKFLWESYTQCLDLLRNNAKLEILYHDIAQMAFTFCLGFNRKTEFRKLCERLRKHFDDILNRTVGQPSNIDFSSPETQQLNMETRLAQLDAAITMELWQEAYKAIEDIHLLMNQSRKSQTRMMAYYYQKLSLVFWKAGNLLFHAATLLKYYNLCKDMKKNVLPQELQKNASQVVLATLAIPFPVVHPEFERFVESEKGMLEKAQKLANLLFLPSPPTRASLIRDLERYGVLANSSEELQTLHKVLEAEFNPLELCTKVDMNIKIIKNSPDNEVLEQYLDYLEDVTLVRFIKQISQIYQSIEYERLLELSVFTDQYRLEQLIVDMVRYSDMQITIDHRDECVRFGTILKESPSHESEEILFQEMPSEFIRYQLVNVFSSLSDAIDLIAPDHISITEEKLRNKIYSNYLLTGKKDHVQALQRPKIVADRREEIERSALERENEEKWRSEQVLKQQLIMEEKRLETEREEREKRKREMEIAEIQQKKIRDKLGQMAQTKLGRLVVSKLEEDDLEKLDIETMMQKQQQELQKEASERLIRLSSQYKRLDHLERGRRLEEIPAIQEFMNKKKEQEKEEWELHDKERIAHLIEERKISVKNRDRMKRMREDKNSFIKQLLDARRDVFLKHMEEYEHRLETERAKRLAERKAERIANRRRQYLEEREEEERRREEALRKEKEESIQKEKERAQREADERNRITFEMQRAKDREIEERLENDKKKSSVPAEGIRQLNQASNEQSPRTDVYRPKFRQADNTAPVSGRSVAGDSYQSRARGGAAEGSWRNSLGQTPDSRDRLSGERQRSEREAFSSMRNSGPRGSGSGGYNKRGDDRDRRGGDDRDRRGGDDRDRRGGDYRFSRQSEKKEPDEGSWR